MEDGGRSEGKFAWLGGAIRALIPALRSSATSIRSIRSLGVASEVGTAAKPILPQNRFGRSVVPACWGASIVYVIADIGVRVESQPEELRVPVLADLALWHTSASLVVPAVIIGKIVHVAQDIVGNIQKLPAPIKRWTPVTVAVASIYPIVPAVDQATDWIMDRTVRGFLGTKGIISGHEQHTHGDGKERHD